MDEASIHESLLWDQDGHLSELALSALADEQTELLGAQPTLHLEGCAHCSERLVALMVSSVHLDLELPFVALQSEQEEISLRAASAGRFPANWFMMVVVMVAVGMSQGLQSAVLRVPAVLREAGVNLRLFVSVLILLRDHSSILGPQLALALLALTLATFALLQRVMVANSKETMK